MISPDVLRFVPTERICFSAIERPRESRAVLSEKTYVLYGPDTVLDGWTEGGCTFRAVSLRGDSHRSNGSPRQDDFAACWDRNKSRLVVAVADGVSAAPLAHVGAYTAVRCAIRWLSEQPAGEELIDWMALVRDVSWALVERCGTLGFGKDPTRAQQELATTLQCAVIDTSPDVEALRYRLFSIGDGSAWQLSAIDGVRRLCGGKGSPDELITSSAVAALPGLPTSVAEFSGTIGRESVLLLGTDGVGDPIGSGDGPIGAFLTESLRTPPTLTDFARIVEFHKETFDDDRTMVAIWPQ
jgi:hypothetical protein